MLAGVAATATAQNTASGTLTAGAGQFEMKYAAAAKVAGKTRIVIADKPIPEDVMDDEAEIWDLKSKDFHGLEVEITADKSNYSVVVISSTIQGTHTHSGTFDAKRLTAFTDKRVEGSLEAPLDEATGAKLGWSVKFAAVVAPPETPPTPADTAAAAGKESTKAYLALVAAIRAGDKQKIMDLGPPDRRAMIDTPQFPEMLKIAQAMLAQDIKVLKATETGDKAILLARGTMDGQRNRAKIYMNRVNGKWIMMTESWSTEK
jgi:hypothetical protein